MGKRVLGNWELGNWELGNKVTGRAPRSFSPLTLFLIALPLLLFFLITASPPSLSDPETSQDFTADAIATISPGHSVGQTFVARRPRLDSITLWTGTDQAGAQLTVELFHSPNDAQPLFSTEVDVRDGTTTIPLEPPPDPPGQRYFLRLTPSQGEVKFYGRDEDQYPGGTVFIDGQPFDADLAFQTTYTYDWGAAWTDLRGIAGHWALILPLGLLLLLPGWLLLDFTSLRRRFDLGEQIALSVGLSIAALALLMQWTSVLGLRWSRASVLWGAGALLALALWKGITPLHRRRPSTGASLPGAAGKQGSHPAASTGSLPSSPLLLAIFLFTLFVRFAMVRDLAAPAWVDSVHHGLITQSILKTGGYPPSYRPHIPLDGSQYHPGYHALLATFLWLTKADLRQGMLLLGQVLNALMVFPVYLLTKTLTRDRWAGIVAGLITSLLTLMPAYYTSWGRYTQLTGLLMVPAAFAMLIPASRRPRDSAAVLLAGLTLAGLFIVHYRVIVFCLLLWLAYWISRLYRPSSNTPQEAFSALQGTAFSGAIALFLSLPWLIPTLTRLILPQLATFQGTSAPFSGFTWRYLTPIWGKTVLVLAGLGALLAIAQRRRFVIAVLLWVIFLFGVAVPNPFGIPFLPGFINQNSVEITLFLPLSVLGGYLVTQLGRAVSEKLPGAWKTLWLAGLFSLGMWVSAVGAQRQLTILNPVTFLFRQGDAPAMDWIGANIPEGETLVINPAGWGYGLYMGYDGGFWIAPLTGRQTMPPNVLYGMNSSQRERVNAFVEALLPSGEDAAAIWELMDAYGLRYIYLGVRGGVISPRALQKSPLFNLLYHDQGAWVFQALERP